MATTTKKIISNPDVVDALAAVGIKIPGKSSSLPPGKAKDDVYVKPTTKTTTPTYKAPVALPKGKAKDDVYVKPATPVVRPTSTQRVKDDVAVAPRPGADPLMNAINKWRASTQPQAQQAMGPQPAPISPWKPSTQLIPVGQPMQVGLTSPRPDTAVTGVTAPSAWAPTVSSPVSGITPQRITDRAQDGFNQDRAEPTPIQQRINAMGLSGEAPTTSYTDMAPVGQFFNDVWSAYNNSAAKERMDYTVAANNRAFNDRQDTSLMDVARSFGQWGEATAANNAAIRDEFQQWRSGEQSLAQGLGDYWDRMRFGEITAPIESAMNISRPTADFGRGAQNVLAGLQSASDMLYNYPYIGNTPPSAYLASVEDKLLQASRGEGSQAPLTLENLWTDFSQQVQKYRDAVTPTPEQAVRLSDSDLAMNQQRAYLNTLGGEQSVVDTFDQLVDQKTSADNLWQRANEALLAGSQTVDEDARQELWRQAAQDGAEAYRLENAHPVEIVNQNTNLVRQLINELLLPDVTDVAAGIFSLAGLTPKARRLTSTVAEIMTPEATTLARLRDFAVTADNAVAVASETSSYNKFLDLWHVGRTKADIAGSRMLGPVTSLIADTDKTSDVKVILQTLATTPAKIVEGIPGNLFQSPLLLGRALDENGLVKFGSVGLDRVGDGLRIFQQMAGDFLANAESLKAGPIINKNDFANELLGYMRQAGYRYYNVGEELAGVPVGTATARIKNVPGGEAVVEYVGVDRKVLGTSDPMAMAQARKLKDSVLIDVKSPAPRSLVGKVGSFERNIVTPLNLFTSPGTMLTNLFGGLTMSIGDNVLSLASRDAMRSRVTKLFGANPTARGLEGIESALTFANQSFTSGGPMKYLKRLYGSIDEAVGERVFDAALTHGLGKAGKPILQKSLTPILQSMGYTDGRAIKKITNHLFEIGAQGGDMLGEFARVVTGNTRLFSLGDVNPTWLGSVPPAEVENLYTVLRTAPDAQTALAKVNEWRDAAYKYWDEITAAAPRSAQRHSWMAAENVADAGDIAKDVKKAAKHSNLAAEQAQALGKAAQDGLKQTEAGMRTLQELVTASGNPANRHVLYNIWQQSTELTQAVRYKLGELADAANELTGPARKVAWDEYMAQVPVLWGERHAAVGKLLEEGANIVASGAAVAPSNHALSMIERVASQAEAALWGAMQMEPGSGAWDGRLKQVIDAGRAISDKAVARVYYAAMQFPNVDAFDHIVSAERNIAEAGAQVRHFLNGALTDAQKSGDWDNYFYLRNKTQREFRVYEKDIWALAERSIVSEGTDKVDDALKAGAVAHPFDTEAQKILETAENAPEALGAPIPPKTTERTTIAAAPSPSPSGEVIGGLQEQAASLFDPGKELDLSKNLTHAERTIKNTTAAGGIQAEDWAMGAAFARQQLDAIVDHISANIGEILTPVARNAVGEGQGLRAIEDFKRTVLPAWDNAKTIAGRYGDKMRSFTMIDANITRLDEIAGLYMPFGVWAMRSMKNSLERAIFEPHIWRRVMQTERDVRAIQDQRDDPERYEGGIPYDDGSGVVRYIQYLPSKLWQAFGLFTQNDYADPESANNAFSFGVESLRSANMNPYPWIEAAQKLYAGEGDEIYPMTFASQGRILADLAVKFMGKDTPGWLFPGYFENNTARTLNNMAVNGEITHDDARWAHDLLWQIKNDGMPLTEQASLDMQRLEGILDEAMKRTAGVDLQTAVISWATGANVKAFDTSEKQWAGAQSDYYDFQYGPENPYGSHLASQVVKEDAALAFSKGAVWKPEEQRPGIGLVNDEKKQAKEAINNDLMAATDAWINSLDKDPKNAEINDFKLQYVQGKYGADGEYFGEAINNWLDQSYPSATTFDGQPTYQGYNPEERQDAARRGAYYQAKEDLAEFEAVWPGDNASRAEKAQYYDDKEAYDAAFTARVDQIISDPQMMSSLAGRQMYQDFSGAPYDLSALQSMPMSEAFGVPNRPTGNSAQPMMTGLLTLAGSPTTAEEIIQAEKTKYMGAAEQAVRERNAARSGGGGGRGGSRRRSSRRGGGGGGGGGGFRWGTPIDPRYLQGSLWPDANYIEKWRPQGNPNWLEAGRNLAPGQPREWRPISWKI